MCHNVADLLPGLIMIIWDIAFSGKSVKLKDHLALEEKNIIIIIRNTKQCANGSNVANHAWTFDHIFDFGNSTVIDRRNHCTRKTVESTWQTAKTVEADNNSCSLVRQYNILLNNH